MKYLILLVLLSGCATARYQRKLDGWIGEPQDKLVSSWGAPTQIMDLSNGGKTLTYISSSGSVTRSQYLGYGGFQSVAHDRSCKTNFSTDATGEIVQYSFQGHGCR